METESRKIITFEDFVERQERHKKLIFMTKVSCTGKYVEFALDLNKTYIYRRRFVIAHGFKIT